MHTPWARAGLQNLSGSADLEVLSSSSYRDDLETSVMWEMHVSRFFILFGKHPGSFTARKQRDGVGVLEGSVMLNILVFRERSNKSSSRMEDERAS